MYVFDKLSAIGLLQSGDVRGKICTSRVHSIVNNLAVIKRPIKVKITYNIYDYEAVEIEVEFCG